MLPNNHKIGIKSRKNLNTIIQYTVDSKVYSIANSCYNVTRCCIPHTEINSCYNVTRCCIPHTDRGQLLLQCNKMLHTTHWQRSTVVSMQQHAAYHTLTEVNSCYNVTRCCKPHTDRGTIWDTLTYTRQPRKYPIKYTHVFVVFCLLWLYHPFLLMHVIHLPIFFRVTSLALGQFYCPSASEVALKDMGKIEYSFFNQVHVVS